jgi:hypothetical protein
LQLESQIFGLPHLSNRTMQNKYRRPGSPNQNPAA